MPNSTSKHQAFTTGFKVITTGWTWVKCEGAEGQRTLSQLGYGENENECCPPSQMVVRLGLKLDLCSSTLTTMYVSIICFRNEFHVPTSLDS